MSDLGFVVCDELARAVATDDLPLVYSSKFREFGLAYADGGSSFLLIAFCPFCGEQLPGSLRDEWFDSLEQLGLEPEDSAVPEVFSSDRWWRQ